MAQSLSVAKAAGVRAACVTTRAGKSACTNLRRIVSDGCAGRPLRLGSLLRSDVRGPRRFIARIASVPAAFDRQPRTPARFHHMLRVFKPSSPMNLGAWALSGYSLPVTLLATRQVMEADAKESSGAGANQNGTERVLSKLMEAPGMPFAFTMLSYPGVLLSTTSTPVWGPHRPRLRRERAHASAREFTC